MTYPVGTIIDVEICDEDNPRRGVVTVERAPQFNSSKIVFFEDVREALGDSTYVSARGWYEDDDGEWTIVPEDQIADADSAAAMRILLLGGWEFNL